MTFQLIACSFALFLIFYAVRKEPTDRKWLPLPPGPKGRPFLGNVADLPPKGMPEWQHWLKHKHLYGPISSVTVFRQTIILIHDKDIAFEILHKGAANFSSRPQLVFAGEMVGYNRWLAFQQCGDTFRYERKLMARQLGSTRAVMRFEHSLDVQVRRLLLKILQHPDDFKSHLKYEAASLMLDMLYGYETSQNRPDHLARLANQVMTNFSEATVAGAWAVDFIPWLQYLPDWVPGTGFKQTARNWSNNLQNILRVPTNFVIQQRKRGVTKESYASRLLDNDEEHMRISTSASALYAGGADTTPAVLEYFLLAMSVFPEVQAQAHEEIDLIIGSDARLPGFQDAEKLLYVRAMVAEAHRWQSIGPLGLPHATAEEDEYRGYRIPKGAIILLSVKWFSIDPEVYKDPELFNPERFLGCNPEPLPQDFAFGFGRRLCPGRYLADAHLLLAIAQILAVFTIKKSVDEATGKEIEPVIGGSSGIFSHPVPFKCRILPRSGKHAQLIRNIENEHSWGEGHEQLLENFNIKG